MEENADKQTITNKNDASEIHKTITQKSSTNRRSTEVKHVVEKIKSASTKNRTKSIQFMYSCSSPDGLEVRAFRCGRGKIGSNHGLVR